LYSFSVEPFVNFVFRLIGSTDAVTITVFSYSATTMLKNDPFVHLVALDYSNAFDMTCQRPLPKLSALPLADNVTIRLLLLKVWFNQISVVCLQSTKQQQQQQHHQHQQMSKNILFYFKSWLLWSIKLFGYVEDSWIKLLIV